MHVWKHCVPVLFPLSRVPSVLFTPIFGATCHAKKCGSMVRLVVHQRHVRGCAARAGAPSNLARRAALALRQSGSCVEISRRWCSRCARSVSPDLGGGGDVLAATNAAAVAAALCGGRGAEGWMAAEH
eukprot:56832-Pleurochrysis_carterae.AAC.2